MSSTLHSDQEVASLRVMVGGQQRQNRTLREGDRLVLGSDETADVVLQGDDVAPTHCLLTAENGAVRVRDCYSVSGTRVNGHTVREMELNRNAQIQIDHYEIRLTLRSPQETRAAVFMEPEEPSPAAQPDVELSEPHNESLTEQPRVQPLTEPSIELATSPALTGDATDADASAMVFSAAVSADTLSAEPQKDHSTAEPPDEHAADAPPVDLTSDESLMSQLHRIQLELIQARTENRILTDQLQQATEASSGQEPADPFENEMVELLKAEVIDLQNALAAQQDSAPAAVAEESGVSAEEAERLVARLEELLAELQERDEQVATLAELLEATENSHDAEQRERQQVNDWLAEIEHRFGEREVEWETQNRQLQEQLNAAVKERERAETVASSENTDARLLATQEVLAGLRETAERLQQQLTDSQQEVSRLNRQAAEHGQERDREEQIRLAEEKAEVARQKQELEAARHLQRTQESNESTLKLKALREHLNEIHEKEQKEQEERRLSSRLARLWKRLDGR